MATGSPIWRKAAVTESHRVLDPERTLDRERALDRERLLDRERVLDGTRSPHEPRDPLAAGDRRHSLGDPASPIVKRGAA